MTAVDVNVDRSLFDGTDGTSQPLVTAVPPPTSPPVTPCPPQPGVYVKFHLGPPVYDSSIFGTPASVPSVNGALHLIWTGPGGGPRPRTDEADLPAAPPRTSGTTREAEARDEAREAEDMIRAAVERLPAQQRRLVMKARTLPGTRQVAMHRLPPLAPARVLARA